MRGIVLVIFFVYCICIGAYQLDPSRIVVSITLDAESEKVTRQALRLLTSLRLYGGTLNQARLAVCIAYTEPFRNDILLHHLSNFNITSLIFTPRYTAPLASSLNKLCSLNPLPLTTTDYLLYLDADIIIAHDPVPILEQYMSVDISCGYPWSGMPNLHLFPEYVNTTYDFTRRMPTISPGGDVFYGMCNTGMFFVRGSVVPSWVATAKRYLQKSLQEEHYQTLIPFSPSYFGIDSIILWAAQYALNLSVGMLPLQMNYIVASEDYVFGHIQRDQDTALESGTEHWEEHVIIRPRTPSGERVNFNESQVYLAHMSTGSDAFFGYKRLGNTCPYEYACAVHFKGQLSPSPASLARVDLLPLLVNPAFCNAVAEITNVTLSRWIAEQVCLQNDDTILLPG